MSATLLEDGMEAPTLFDAHCHLGARDYRDDLPQVLQRARDAGVRTIVTVGSGYGLGGNELAVEIAHAHEGVYAVVGVHPHEADQVGPGDLDRIEALSHDPRVVAWGECGLDYYRDRSPRDVQRAVFREQIGRALARRLPLVLHIRQAEEDALRILDEERAWDTRVLIHCFTHDWAFAREVLERGAYLSVPGVATYRNARAMQEALVHVPNEVLLLETDGPFLAPVPHRGTRNEPAYLPLTAEAVARIKGLAPRDVARASTRAARVFYGLAEDTAAEGAIAYRIRDSLYLNITNRCSLACTFCHKFQDFTVAGHFLNLRGHEPDAGEILLAATLAAEEGSATRADVAAARAAGRTPGDLSALEEVAFVGYGESTRRLPALLEAARRLRSECGARRVRLDTDGLASLREGRDVVPELAAVFDAVSVSVNAPDAGTYAELCPSRYREGAYEAVVAFLRRCVEAQIPWVQGTVVGVPGLDVEACRERVEETGARFRERVYHVVG